MVLTRGIPCSCLFRTDLGEMGLVWSMTGDRPSVMRLFTGSPGTPAAEQMNILFPGTKASVGPLEPVVELLVAFTGGEDVTFPLSLADLELCSGFQRSVLTAEHSIPRGSVMTYSSLATLAGHPGSARAAGSALARNPFPLIIPCHRTVRSDGRPGGFQGGSEMKRRLLEREGVIIGSDGRVPGERITTISSWPGVQPLI